VDEQFWLMLVAKMLTTAAIVVIASLLIERSGPLLGTLLATLPISAGPAYVFLAVEHGPAFIQASALASLPANAATPLFILTYAALASRGQGLAVCLASALASWGVTVGVIPARAWSLPALLVLNIVVFAGGSVLAKRFIRGHKVPGPLRRWWNIPVRVLSVMLLVGAVVIAGRALGPAAAGIAALAPVVLTSLVLILHPHIGGPATASVLATGLPGLFGFVLALTAVYLLVLPHGSTIALSSALAISLVWNVSVLLLHRSSTPSTPKW
jgi:hypothetical protein